MPVYRCRTIKPKVTEWKEISADRPELAANELHCRFNPSEVVVADDRTAGRKYLIGLADVEVEGHGSWVSRVFYYAIWRKGRPHNKSFEERLKAAAATVGFTRDPMEILEDGWDGEEGMSQGRPWHPPF